MGRFLLRNGQGVTTDAPGIARSEFVVAADLDGNPRESRLWLAAPLEREEVLSLFGHQVTTEDLVEWDPQADLLLAVRRERLGALVLAERPLRDPDPAHRTAAVAAQLQREGLARLPWGDDARQLRARLGFLHRHLGPPWPAMDDAALLGRIGEWLGPSLDGVRRRADLDRLDLAEALLRGLGWEERRRLDELAPTHLAVPTGSRIRVDYTDPEAPVLAVRLQEVFGLTETPRLAGGRVPVTMHLLSPAHRPVQVTRDLAGFWQSSYFDVRKEMKGRYPRHPWPDDPLQATPTRRAKPRGE